MKNYYNNWLRESSTLRQTGQESAKSNTMWRYVAMIFAVLVMSVANIGMA